MSFAAYDPFGGNNDNSVGSAAALPSRVWVVRYANVKALADLIKSSGGLLSAQGKIIADERSNQLWVSDDPVVLNRIQTFVHQFDRPMQQILIKARLVSIDDQYVKTLGIIFGMQTTNASTNNGLQMDMPATNFEMGVATIPIAKLGSGNLLDLQLSALADEGHADIISKPELLTNNRQAALIESGDEVPYQEKTGEGNTSVAFKKAVLRLKVTPVLLPNHRVLLQLAVNQDRVSSLVVNGVPAIHTQQIDTTVLMRDQQTVMLGGIYEQENTQQQAGVPGLQHVPMVGGLFRQNKVVNNRKQLLIFVTPEIVGNE